MSTEMRLGRLGDGRVRWGGIEKWVEPGGKTSSFKFHASEMNAMRSPLSTSKTVCLSPFVAVNIIHEFVVLSRA